jgi:protein-tyrosine phosphatase
MSEVITSRVIEFEGADNFRDLGGYESRFGGTVRWGRVFRSGILHRMSASDLDRLRDLGLRRVYDLRSEIEFHDDPDPVPAINVPVLGRFIAESGGGPPELSGVVGHDGGVEFMRNMNLNILEWGGPEVGRVISGLADDEALPALFHCTAGKDRTGIIAALLLEVLGVDRDTVLDDFTLTDQLRGPIEESAAFQRMLSHGMPAEAAAGALGAPRHMMGDVLVELDARYGGAERYLVEQAGVDADVPARLRELLLT